MTEHSKYFAPSALSRRIACPGSALLEAELKEKIPDEPNEAARQGTAAHAICEQCQTSGGASEPKDWLNRSVDLEDGGEPIPITETMVNACDRALAMMRKITEGRAVETEKRVEMPDLREMFGTVDALVNEPPLLIVCDYKFGVGKVEVKENAQLMAYALMAAGEHLEEYTDIRLVVIQPTERDKPFSQPTERNEPKVFKVSPQDLAGWRVGKLMPAVRSIRRSRWREAPPEYHPAPHPRAEPCLWCKGNRNRDERGNPLCPARAEADGRRPA